MRGLARTAAFGLSLTIWTLLSSSFTQAQGETPDSASSLSLMQRYAGATRLQLDAQREALNGFRNPKLMRDARGIPVQIHGESDYYVPKDISTPAGRTAFEQVLNTVRAMLLAEGTEKLTMTAEPRRRMHLRFINFAQSIRGIPVSDGRLTLTIDDRTGTLVGVSATFLPDRGLPQAPNLSGHDAVAAALSYVQRYDELQSQRPEIRSGSEVVVQHLPVAQLRVEAPKASGEPTLSYHVGALDEGHGNVEPAQARLIWTVPMDFRTSSPFVEIIVDAIDGTVIASRGAEGVSRDVYNASGSTGLGTLARAQGTGPVGDVAVNLAYENFGLAATALSSVGSIGFTSETIKLIVRSGATSQAVTVLPTNEIFFGPGIPGHPNGPVTHLANALDVVAHEFTHLISKKHNELQCVGVTCAFAGSAILEGISDIAGIVSELNYGVPGWYLLGNDVWTSGMALRSASSPVTFSDGRDFYPLRSLANSHRNATILTHVYYLLTDGFIGESKLHARAGLSGIPSISVPVIGHEKARSIMYGAMQDQDLGQNPSFLNAKSQMTARALSLYDQSISAAVFTAFEAVGVNECTNGPPPPPTPSITTTLICPWWRVTLGSVPGATTYHSEMSLYPNYSPAVGFHDSPSTGDCEVYPYVWVYFRARACNACGCSGWSPNAIAYPWEGECP